ncbi:MAG: transporter substrate-binding domain-containing protein [Leptolyngbyaceae cyanobacterium bins.302]|nr:transporter substrate-binding domain-containing protein [Leptolyngbyaceae cyanobacterium bins.302]
MLNCKLKTILGVWRGYTPIFARYSAIGGMMLVMSGLLGWAAIAPGAQAAELEEIRERGYLIVAVKDNLPPLGFRDDSGQLEGLEIDVARRLAEELLGRSDAITFIPVANQDRLSALLEGEVDLVIARMTVTGSRARLVDFSFPYYVDGTAFVTRDGTVQDVSDLQTRRIAILNGSTSISSVRSLLPSAELVGVDSYQAALDQLEASQADAFAADASVLTGWVQHHPRYRLLPTLISAEALCIAMPRGLQYDPLRQQINDAIAQWYASGWLIERINFWGLPR